VNAAESLNRASRIIACAAAVAAPLCVSSLAHAGDTTIRTPGARPNYTAEVEPHLVLGWVNPPGAGAAPGVGVGVRGSFEVSKDGFLPKLNDSVAIGVGLDWAQYDGRADQSCGDFDTAPNNTRVCVQLGGDLSEVTTFFIPAVMQWNFWLTRRWSVFGEPGLLVHIDDQVNGAWMTLAGGGRFHIQEKFTLTARIGYPSINFGASFLF
jgi:hypothetical protein